jgi:hypothetical protein
MKSSGTLRTADPDGTSIDIGLSVVFDRPHLDAPVSALLYEGRKQDLSFEKSVKARISAIMSASG